MHCLLLDLQLTCSIVDYMDDKKLEAAKLRHKRFISLLQLAIGIISALILALLGYYLTILSDIENNRIDLLGIIVLLFVIGLLIFIFLNSKLSELEEGLGYSVESEGKKLTEIEIKILNKFYEESHKIASGLQLSLDKLFPDLKIDGKDVMPFVKKLQREGYIEQNFFQKTYNITNLGVQYIYLEQEIKNLTNFPN